MKIIKYITVILIIAAFTTGCNSVKKTLRGDKDQNIDEFLVKKKNPLVIPPNFDDLPKPQSDKDTIEDEDEDIDFSGLLKTSKTKKKSVVTKESSLEKSISNILNNN